MALAAPTRQIVHYVVNFYFKLCPFHSYYLPSEWVNYNKQDCIMLSNHGTKEAPRRVLEVVDS